MSDVKELEKQLAQAKEKAKRESLEQECKALKLEYENKAFGSRTFERKAKTAVDYAIYIKQIYIGTRSMGDEEVILADIWTVNITRFDSSYKFSRNNYNYSRSRDTEKQLSSNDSNAGWNLYQMLPWLKKEIPVEKFMSLWNSASEHETVIQDSLKDNLENYQDLIRQGDSTNESRIEQAIATLGFDIIDVQKEHPALWEEIKYCDLPMFQNQKWLPKVFAKDILLYQISLWEKDKSNPWSNYKTINWKNRQIKVIRDHLHYF